MNDKTEFDVDTNESGQERLFEIAPDALHRGQPIDPAPHATYDGLDHLGAQADAMDIEIGEQSTEEYPTPCEFLCGSAGTGKTFEIRRRIQEDSNYATLTASTGIAAVNLGATTIHSTLGFFDTDSLRDAFLQGSAQRKLRKIHEEGYQNVVLDEISMVSNTTLDLLLKIFDEVNTNRPSGSTPVGLVLVGDFAQLPPIAEKSAGRKAPTPWAFESPNWKRFHDNTTRLSKVWRQADARFLAALNYARSGRGQEMAGLLASANVEFHSSRDINFDGTTIVSQNIEVDRFNGEALNKVQGRLVGLPSRRWGKLRPEWNNIPERTIVRENAYVMLLANLSDGLGSFEYVNGDCGHIRGIEPSKTKGEPPSVQVELVRNSRVVNVRPLVRGVEFKDRPDGMTVEESIPAAFDFGNYIPRPHYRGKTRRYVTGQVEYYPIRLAYASTVHKSQGLSLDRVQIDVNNWSMANPGMVYVALSRCRTMEGLRLIGMKERFAERCKVDAKVKQWL